MKSKSKRLMIAVTLSVVLAGCTGSDDGDLSFSIYATPSRTHAPIDVSFELLRDDGGDAAECQGTWSFGDGVSLSGEYETRHVYRKAGKYEVGVELDCGGSHGKSTTTVEIFDSVDLSVTGVQARPMNISTGGVLNVSLQVGNSANVVLGVPAMLDVYLTPTANPEAYRDGTAIRIYRQTIETLGKSGDENSVVELPLEIALGSSIRTGAYYVVAVVNGDRTVGEVSYADNVAVSSLPVTVLNELTDGADFEALQIDVSPATTSLLSAVTASFRLTNIGATTDESFRYQIWMGAKDDGSERTKGQVVHESTISHGLSNVEQTIQNVLIPITPAVTQRGSYYFWLVLNYDEGIRERDMSNNEVRSALPVRVMEEEVLDADIAVESVKFSPSSTSVGGTALVEAKVVNRGAQPTGSFICTVFLSEDMSLEPEKDIVAGAMNIGNLLANSSVDASSIVEIDTGVKPGSYWVYVFCDSSGVVAEADENNNIQRSNEQLAVTGESEIDLVVGEGRYTSSTSPSDGDEMSFSVKLCNKGKTGAGPSWISATRINMCDSSRVEVDRQIVNGIEAGACESIAFKTPMACDFWCPNYQFEVTADVTNVVLETRKENNTITLPTLSVAGTECVCASDAHEPNDLWGTAKEITSIDADLTICANDKDFFKLIVPANRSYEVHVSHDMARSPLKLNVYHGTSLVATYQGTNELYAAEYHYDASASDNVRISVSGAEKTDVNRYHLTASVYGDSTGVDLAASNLTIDGELSAAEATRVTVKVDNLGSEKTPEVKIGYYLSPTMELGEDAHRLAQQVLAPVAAGASIKAYSDVLLPIDIAGGNYYLIARVDDEGKLNDIRPSNNLTRSAQMRFDRSCYDALDPSDSLKSPRRLIFDSGKIHYTDLRVCQSNDDFYAFDVEHGDQIDIAVSAQTEGDFDIYLYDMEGNEIAASRTASSVEKIHLDYALGTQTLILEVRQVENVYNTRETTYTLDIAKQAAASWLSCSAVYEPNQYPSVAYDLRKAVSQGKTAEICPDSDEDYYRIEMAEGDRLQLGFETTSAMLRAALYRGEAQKFISLLTNLRAQSFDYTAIEGGDYYVRVFTNATSIGDKSYRLRWIGATGVDVGVSNLVAPERVQAGAEVSLSFDVKNDGAESAHYVATITLGKSTIETFEGDIEAGASARVVRKVRIPSTIDTGAYELRVSLTNPNDVNLANNSSSRELTVYPVCAADEYEPNDNILQATALVSSSITGTICFDDEDWFIVGAEAKSASLKVSKSWGLLKIAAYDEQGTKIAESNTGSEVESIAFANAKYIRVKGATSESFASYILKIGN